MTTALRLFALVFGFLFSIAAMASAVVETVSGSVRSGASAASASPVTTGQRLDSGTTIVTGPNSRVILRFDDGQAMLLNDDTEFRISDYVFSAQEPAKDRFVFDLLRGAARSVTALLTRRNPNAYALRVPQATIGIRGTDFMVALVNPAFMAITIGEISAVNAAGTASFAAGATATVATATTLAVSIAATALPAAVAASFNQMGSIAISATGAASGSAAGAGSGAGTAVGAAAGGITLGTVGIIGAAVAAAVAVTSDNSTPQQTTTGTTGSTGTR